jgi:hypothetical protein
VFRLVQQGVCRRLIGKRADGRSQQEPMVNPNKNRSSHQKKACHGRPLDEDISATLEVNDIQNQVDVASYTTRPSSHKKVKATFNFICNL